MDSLTTDIQVGFDTLIIDEACQAIELSTLIPFRFQPLRCVLVGGNIKTNKKAVPSFLQSHFY
jgi:superfamily I DNA and/or RNA helicase